MLSKLIRPQSQLIWPQSHIFKLKIHFAEVSRRPNSWGCCSRPCSQPATDLVAAPVGSRDSSRCYGFLSFSFPDFLPKEKSLRFRFLASSLNVEESVEMLSSVDCWYWWLTAGGSLTWGWMTAKGVADGRLEMVPAKDSRKPPADWELVRIGLQVEFERILVRSHGWRISGRVIEAETTTSALALSFRTNRLWLIAFATFSTHLNRQTGTLGAFRGQNDFLRESRSFSVCTTQWIVLTTVKASKDLFGIFFQRFCLWRE